MKLIKIVALFLVLTASTKLLAQDYKKAVGVRGGFPTALNGKYFIKPDVALEGILSGYGGGAEFTALYEIHKNAFDIPYLNWYYGAGVHAGFFSNNVLRPNYYFTTRGTGFALGLDGILGIEYRLTDIPFVIGADMKPSLDFLPAPRIWPGGAVSVRFYF